MRRSCRVFGGIMLFLASFLETFATYFYHIPTKRFNRREMFSSLFILWLESQYVIVCIVYLYVGFLITINIYSHRCVFVCFEGMR